MNAQGGANTPDLPGYLCVSWGWLFVASLAEQALQSYFHWHRFSGVNILLLWGFLQAGWLLRVDRKSKAIYWYAANAIFYLASSAILGNIWPPHDKAAVSVNVAWALAGMGLRTVGVFVFRREMMRYFNSKSVGLDLSAWMTFFFSTLYFQYHFNDISEHRGPDPLRITPVTPAS